MIKQYAAFTLCFYIASCGSFNSHMEAGILMRLTELQNFVHRMSVEKNLTIQEEETTLLSFFKEIESTYGDEFLRRYFNFAESDYLHESTDYFGSLYRISFQKVKTVIYDGVEKDIIEVSIWSKGRNKICEDKNGDDIAVTFIISANKLPEN